MVLNRIVCVVMIVISVSQTACNRTMPSSNMAIAKEALQEYCKGESISLDSFNDANVYREKEYDWCVEYITKTNVPQKHVLLLFFKNKRIVERHRLIEPEP